MSILSKSVKGIVDGKHITLVYGMEGCGKSTFASGYPNPYFIDLETGTRHLDVVRATIEDIGDYAGLLKFLETEVLSPAFTFSTLVIDSLTALETLMIKHICGIKYKNLGDIPYGGGTVQLVDEGVKLMNLLRKIQRDKNIDIILIGHVKQKQYTDAYDNSSYSRFVIQAHEGLIEKMKAAVDNVFFAKYQINTFINDKTKKMQAISDGTRVMYTAHRAGADAKTRLNIPYELPFSYEALQKAIAENKPKPASELVEDIKGLASKADSATQQLVSDKIKDAGDNVATLMKIKSKLTEMVSAT